VISGLSDIPSDQLEGKTPLEAAKTPFMDHVSEFGRIGMVGPWAGERTAGSEKALLTLLGYDPKAYPIRRGPLEAVGLGVELAPDDLAMRLNFVSTFNHILMDHNAGQIGNAESASLIKMLNARSGNPSVRYFHGSGYRNVAVLKGGGHLEFKTVPPHDALHQPVVDFNPYGSDASVVIDLMDKAQQELVEHDINRVRVDLGENPADRIWLWGEGRDFQLPPFESLFPLKGSLISAAPLLKGIAAKIGIQHIPIPGATGYIDTNFEAKARGALTALMDSDLVIIHVGAVNEICHQGDVVAKMRAIEEIDKRLLGPVLQGLSRFEKWRLMVTSDHITPVEATNPLNQPVPMAFCGYEVEAIRKYKFFEETASDSDLYIEKGQDLMEYFLSIKRT